MKQEQSHFQHRYQDRESGLEKRQYTAFKLQLPREDRQALALADEANI
jgi:hypothetical protein